MARLFLPPGVQSLGRAESAGTAERFQLRLGNASYLSELSDEWSFYTPALLHIYVPDAPDLWAEFSKKYGDVKQATVKFDKPLFRGLDVGYDEEWNYVLYAVHRDLADAWRLYLGSTMMYRPNTLNLYHLGASFVTVSDPLPRTRVPFVLWALSLRTNNGVTYLANEPGDPRPHPVFKPGTDQAHTKLLQALVSGESEPYAQLDQEEELGRLKLKYPNRLSLPPERSLDQVPESEQADILKSVEEARRLGICPEGE